MTEHYRKKEEKELIKRFEMHLKRGDNQYFDEDDFLIIINFYLESDKMKWALKACDLGLMQYEYSTDLMSDKAEILARTGKLSEAISCIDAALIYAPGDVDLLMQKGSLHTMSGEYLPSIACFKKILPMSEDQDEILSNRSSLSGIRGF